MHYLTQASASHSELCRNWLSRKTTLREEEPHEFNKFELNSWHSGTDSYGTAHLVALTCRAKGGPDNRVNRTTDKNISCLRGARKYSQEDFTWALFGACWLCRRHRLISQENAAVVGEQVELVVCLYVIKSCRIVVSITTNSVQCLKLLHWTVYTRFLDIYKKRVTFSSQYNAQDKLWGT